MSEDIQRPAGGSESSGQSRWLSIGGMVALAIVVLVILPTSYVRYRNQLITLETHVDTQWSQIETQLVRQHELIPNIVAVTSSYAEHERDVFVQVAQARSQFDAATGQGRVSTGAGLENALFSLMAVVEAYPDIKADRRYQDLQAELAGSQNRVAIERLRYNELVGLYNARLRMIPWRLASGGLEPREFFEADPEQLTTPVVDL